ncbi:MAG TPA: hypothetical protein GXX75_13875 [Clostridiales bacterium]|nr:hypothetical protein [Clostridiales bacterium]
MHISDYFDLEVLVEFLRNWSQATGIAVVAIDHKGKYITEGIGWHDFCMKYTRGSKEGNKRCIQCDQEGEGTYYCHAGLMDFTVDIRVGDIYLGKIIGGQVLPNPPDEPQFRELAMEIGKLAANSGMINRGIKERLEKLSCHR